MFINYFNPQLFSLLQVIGFSLVTIGLVSTKDSFRYFLNLGGTFFIIGGSIIGVYLSYNNGSIDGISLGYMLLTTTALIYFLKLLPKYINKKIKK
ncbi:MAG: hypothetical protein Q9M94_04290 [Candidatus Gracilibacteria bacterium]|nr:hypothetical protein [Candidatus Gracilibacteria bacterium]